MSNPPGDPNNDIFPTGKYGGETGQTDSGDLDLIPPTPQQPPPTGTGWGAQPTPPPPTTGTGRLAGQPHTTGTWGQPPAPPRSQKRGSGCLGTVLFLLVVAAVVGAAVLFLPPFSLADRLFGGGDYEMLDTANPSITDESGFTFSIGMSDEAFGVRVTAYDAAEDTPLARAHRAVPNHLGLLGPIYAIETRGTAPATVKLDVPAPPGIDAETKTAELYAWDGAAWRFVPSRLSREGDMLSTETDTVPKALAVFEAGVLPPLVGTVLEVDQTLTPEDTLALNVLFPAGLEPTADGALTGELIGGFEMNAGYLVLPVVRNFTTTAEIDSRRVAEILRSDEARTLHAQHLREFAAGNGYDGVALDYRNLPPEYQDQYSLLVAELAALLHADGRRLAVFLPTPAADGPSWDTGAYDWRALGRAADFALVHLPDDPSAYAPSGTAEQMLRWAVDEISRYKLLAALSSLSVAQSGDQFAPTAARDAVASLGTVSLLSTSEQPYFIPGTTIEAVLDPVPAGSGQDPTTGTSFLETGEDARVWLTTPRVLRERLESTIPLRLGGVCALDVLDTGTLGNMTNALVEFQAKVPAEGGADPLAVRWTVRTGAGETVSEEVAGLATPFAWTASDQGTYLISAYLEGELSGGRGEVAVPVAQPTATPTPVPTATPTPPPPAQGTGGSTGQDSGGGEQSAPPQDSGGTTSYPPISGGFELGGHVNTFANPDAMRHAGMSWAKRQLRYRVGDGAGNASWMIGESQAQGFKILLGIVGYPEEINALGLDGYIQNFTTFLTEVAKLGPNAIEVWNEQNLDREWPHGQIDPAAYTKLLKASYEAIKAANPNVMVISGALAPTGGAAGGTSAAFWNDDVYLDGMVAAGAAQYMDCVGAHYNEGIVPPDWTSGDPRGGHYTRYLPAMINVYSRMGKPICFTELGYLSPEGYGALPGNFGWAANTTVAQHAEWLAGAASYCSSHGVRLMIVWNVDFTNWDPDDPMAGYAILRAGGGCPACDALHNVMVR